MNFLASRHVTSVYRLREAVLRASHASRLEKCFTVNSKTPYFYRESQFELRKRVCAWRRGLSLYV